MKPQKLDTPFCCLNCGSPNDGAINADGSGDPPVPGNIGICACCSHVQAVADDGVSFRELTGDEIIELAGDKDFLKLMKIVELGRRE